MPNYTYADEEGNEHDVSMSISEWEEFLNKNPNYKWVPKIGLPIVERPKKPDSGFRDVLKTIKKGSPRSNVETF